MFGTAVFPQRQERISLLECRDECEQYSLSKKWPLQIFSEEENASNTLTVARNPECTDFFLCLHCRLSMGNEFRGLQSSSEHLRTSRVGCCCDINSCKHSGPLRSTVRARDESHRSREKIGERKRQDGARITRGKYLVERPCTDVLAHPHKKPLMSALPTTDAGTKRTLLLSTY